MNPYLEQDDAWHDFHERFAPQVAEVLMPQVRPAYIVKIDEHVYIHETPENGRGLLSRGAVTVARARPTVTPRAALATLEAPARVRLPFLDEERLSYVEIRDRHSRQLITVIELLSPSNKRSGGDRELYLSKRTELLKSAANLVEIDLLRGGERMPMEDLPGCDYVVLVSRVSVRPEAEVWPLRLRDRLPAIPIPLRSGEPDARLDLQAVVHRIYDAAGYADYVYPGEPDPPLSAADVEWCRTLLTPAG
jgi:hypothetical protein